MRLGTNIPTDEAALVNNEFCLDKALAALRNAGIRGCLTNFVNDEAQWEESSRQLAASLEKADMTLLEYNAPLLILPASRDACEATARAFVRMLEIASDVVGCPNVVACVGGYNGISPHPRNRSREVWDLLEETCLRVADLASRTNPNARLMIELVYTSVIRTPAESAELIDAVNSPHVRGHMDAVNCLSFDTIYAQEEVVRDAFETLGDRFCSAHVKDVAPIEPAYLPGLVQRLVGEGIFDFSTYLECLGQKPPDFPVVIEHIYQFDGIVRSYERIKAIADKKRIPVWDK